MRPAAWTGRTVDPWKFLVVPLKVDIARRLLVCRPEGASEIADG